MSTYLKELTNPKTGQKQVAVCHDDHYGKHIYGYGFKKDGTDFTINDFGKFENVEFYRVENLLDVNNGV